MNPGQVAVIHATQRELNINRKCKTILHAPVPDSKISYFTLKTATMIQASICQLKEQVRMSPLP